MSAEAPGSITRLLDDLKAGQHEAAEAIWRRYYQRVVTLARRQLRSAPHQSVQDVEDVALGAFQGLYAGVVESRFQRLSDRGDLWPVLAAVTAKKALGQRQWHDRRKRGGNHVNTFPGSGGDAGSPDPDKTNAWDWAAQPGADPEASAILREEFQELIAPLQNLTLQQVALWRMDGLNNQEIAQKLGYVPRTVERKLERIRMTWGEIGLGPKD
jgi:DNA-directed RNA polymerase specialized sigma24 family protein